MCQNEVNPESWTKNFQGLFTSRHHTLKEKKEIIRLYQEGASMIELMTCVPGSLLFSVTVYKLSYAWAKCLFHTYSFKSL